MTKLLDLLSAGGATISIITVIEGVQAILCIIASVIAIVTGIISIILKFKKAAEDGIITEEEKEDIFKDVDDIKNKISDMSKKK